MARFVAAFAIRHPPFVICHPPFVICHPPFVICHFSFPIPRAEFRIPHFLESGTGYPISGTKETWLAPFGSAPFDPGWPLSTLFLDTAALTASSFSSFHWPLATDHCSPATRPSSRRPPGPAGSGRAQTLPRWLLPDTDRRISKERTGPDLDERPPEFAQAVRYGVPGTPEPPASLHGQATELIPACRKTATNVKDL